MGNVRTDQIKRTAKELMRRFPDRFTADFGENKKIVNQLLDGATRKIKNQIAGYITRFLAGEVTPEEAPIEEEQAAEEGEGK